MGKKKGKKKKKTEGETKSSKKKKILTIVDQDEGEYEQKESTSKEPTKLESSPPSPTLSQVMLSDAAMYNLYFIAHDAPHALRLRGFDWPDNPNKKGKKKKKK